MGILALGGNIISTLTAYFSGYGRDDIKNGLYGFNGTLVGIAVGVFMELSIWFFIIDGSGFMYFNLDITTFQPAKLTSRIYSTLYPFCMGIIGTLRLDNA